MNILFLMADEFRFDAAGFMGNPVAHTPNLDALARDAVVFDNAYTPAPVCIPARQCLATGRYPLHIDCEEFGEDIAPNSPTFARWFSDHGYYTVACGKLHHRGPDQMQGWLHRIGSETAVHWPEKYGDRSIIGRSKWRGAEELRKAGAGPSALSLHDDYTVRGARDFLRIHFGGLSAAPPDVPLFLMVSLIQPHFPLLTEAALLEKYEARVPIYWNEPEAAHPALAVNRLGPQQGVTEEDVRRATAAYYGMIEQTDRRFGEVLDALREAGQNPDDWLIVFTSDHGDMLGQHGVWEKRKFYEGSARIPLFLRVPGQAARREKAPANLVDLFPTLSRAAGLAVPDDLDGSDLLGADAPAETFSQFKRDQFMVRKDQWKYLRLGPDAEVLFDLESDPEENINRATDPACAGVLQSLRVLLDKFRMPLAQCPKAGD